MKNIRIFRTELFLLGLFIGLLISSILFLQFNKNITGKAISDLQDYKVDFYESFQKKSPGDWIKDNQILVNPEYIKININNSLIGIYTDSKSMSPLLTNYSNTIQIIPNNPNEISIGDIIVFKKDNRLITHRVIEIGQDDKGYWFITQGDNSFEPDDKIRFKDINSVVVGILF